MWVLSVCVIVIIVIVLSNRVVRPIKKLVKGTRKVTGGDLGFKIATQSKDEIGYLACSFNDMTIRLAESKWQIEDYTLNLEKKVDDKTREIRQMLEELEHKNNEMEQIIYVTSHDLRSPLLNIQGFGEELQKSCDEVQINQVFSNLMDNALKYLEDHRAGIVKIFGRREKGHVIYCVEDNGTGISKGHQHKVFDLFHRLNPGGSVVGEGFGLSIVQRILDRHGGMICVESEPGKGSRFFVLLPEH